MSLLSQFRIIRSKKDVTFTLDDFFEKRSTLTNEVEFNSEEQNQIKLLYLLIQQEGYPRVFQVTYFLLMHFNKFIWIEINMISLDHLLSVEQLVIIAQMKDFLHLFTELSLKIIQLLCYPNKYITWSVACLNMLNQIV